MGHAKTTALDAMTDEELAERAALFSDSDGEADEDEGESGDGLTEDARVAVTAIADMVKFAQGPGAPAPKQLDVRWLSISSVRLDGGTQGRVRLDPTIVQDYAQEFTRNAEMPVELALKSSHELWWGSFPPLDVYFDQEYWLADGFHRLAGLRQALERAGLDSYHIRGWRVLCKVHKGSRRDAILHAAGANANHGLRRTNADKRKAVETLLRDEEWQKWSDAEIARRCAVDAKTVGNARHQLELNREIPDTLIRKRADGATVDTTNVGANKRKIEPVRKPTPTPQVKPAEPVYDAPPVPYGTGLTVTIADPIVSDLYQADMNGNAFKTAFLVAHIHQLEQALRLCSSDADPRRYLKLGDRRELLMIAKDAQVVDKLIEAVMPTAEPVPKQLVPPDPRLGQAQLLRYMLMQVRGMARRDYGELTGRHTDLLIWERDTEALLEPLDSLIAILSSAEYAKIGEVSK